jgi:hypothetical protein
VVRRRHLGQLGKCADAAQDGFGVAGVQLDLGPLFDVEPALSSTLLLTPSLPTSCSSAPRLSQRRRSGDRPIVSAIMSVYSATRSLWPLVYGLFESTTWPKAIAISSR